MARLADDLKDRVKDATPIDRLITDYGVVLKRAGRVMKGLCPFHQEKTPSFNVYLDVPQHYHCYGCGANGDVFSFVEEQDRVEFREALQILADRAGIQIEEEPQTAQAPAPSAQLPRGRKTDQRRFLLKLNVQALGFFRDRLHSTAGEPARAYLADRGLSDESVREFDLGYAPDAWDGLCRALGPSPAHRRALVAAGLARARDGQEDAPYDWFRNRLIFPIRDVRGQVVGFAGRTLDGSEPKYLNTPETLVFQKGRLLFGLDRARDALREQGEVLLVEGYTDVMMCAQHGIDNAVAPMGTALGRDHLRLVARHGDRAVLVFDGDEAGIKATEKAVELCVAEGLVCDVVVLPGGADPCEILVEEGREGLLKYLNSQQDGFTFLMDKVCFREDLQRPEGKSEACGRLMEVASGAQDKVARDEYRRRIAERLGVSEGELDMKRRARTGPAAAEGENQRAPVLSARQRAERDLASLCVADPAYLGRLQEAVPSDRWIDPVVKDVLAAFVYRTEAAPDAGPGEVVGHVITSLAENPPAKQFVIDAHHLNMRTGSGLDRDEQFAKALQGLEQVRAREELEAIETALTEARDRGDVADEARFLHEEREIKKRWVQSA